ncbi:hypothetical protein [Aquabacterium sp.]|uniref:hypothetical protein n=1 Tax=Aquabacterium sp. TaxID=1872578 RepID=UPI003D6CF421
MAPRSNAESPTTRPTWPCLRLEGQGERRRIVIDLSASPLPPSHIELLRGPPVDENSGR